MNLPTYVYKILTLKQWQQMQGDGQLVGAPIDVQDGFIHFSTADQTAETLAKHFSNQTHLKLLEVSVESIGAELKWETSRNQELFPHFYSTLPIDKVHRHWDIELCNGVHELPNF